MKKLKFHRLSGTTTDGNRSPDVHVAWDRKNREIVVRIPYDKIRAVPTEKGIFPVAYVGYRNLKPIWPKLAGVVLTAGLMFKPYLVDDETKKQVFRRLKHPDVKKAMKY